MGIQVPSAVHPSAIFRITVILRITRIMQLSLLGNLRLFTSVVTSIPNLVKLEVSLPFEYYCSTRLYGLHFAIDKLVL